METFTEDQHVISPERWRTWEEKARRRGKANSRKITLVVSSALLALWFAGVITSYTLGGSIHILLFIAAGALAFMLFRDAGRFL